MGTLRSYVPDLIRRKGWDTKTFAAHCMLKGLGQDTAYRMARGETNFTTETLVSVAEVLGVKSLNELMDLDKDQ